MVELIGILNIENIIFGLDIKGFDVNFIGFSIILYFFLIINYSLVILKDFLFF